MGARRTPEDRAVALARDQAVLNRMRPSTVPIGERRPPRIRHCWVRRGEMAVEGLLLSWVMTERGWQAEVALVAEDGALRTVVAHAADVRPSDALRPGG